MTRFLVVPLLVATMLLNACGTAGPIVVKCGLQDVQIAAADYAQIRNDINTRNWGDLAAIAEKIGWGTLDCVLGNEAKQNPAAKPNIDEFRRLHAVELRAAGADAMSWPANPPPCYLPGVAEVHSRPGGCAVGVLASDGRFVPIVPAPTHPSLNAAPPAPSMASTSAKAGGSADLRQPGVMTWSGEPVALRSPGDPTPPTSCDGDHPCARRRSLDPEDGFAFDRAPPGVGPGVATAGGK